MKTFAIAGIILLSFAAVAFAAADRSEYLEESAQPADDAGSLSSWLSIVSQQPYSMVMASATTVEYYCDHCGTTIPLARASSWTGRGRDLEGIRVSLLQEGVAYYVQLSATDELGPFEYIIGIEDVNDSIHIHFVAGRPAAIVTHSTRISYEEIALVTGEQLFQGSNWIAGFVSYDVITQFISRSRLGLLQFNFHMAMNTETNRELFVFAVSGWATTP